MLYLIRLIPLDVIINTETGKVIISKILEMDVEMTGIDTMASETGLISCKVQSLQLPEELGYVNHIFSDKTGTLTKNELIFRKLAIRGKVCEADNYQ